LNGSVGGKDGFGRRGYLPCVSCADGCIPEGVESKSSGVEIKTDRAAGEIDNERRRREA
jgi:hypothetical protein